MKEIILSKYTDFLEGSFEGKANLLGKKYGAFDFVWFDCGGAIEYKNSSMNTGIFVQTIFFHYTYIIGIHNELNDRILENISENSHIFDIVEPHKSRQGSITMVRKNG